MTVELSQSGASLLKDGSLSVSEAIDQMSAAVQKGDFALAETIGTTALIPLSIPQSSLKLGDAISEGAQATVRKAELDGYGRVAVKKGLIRQHADLVRLRREVIFLAELQHAHIVTIVGARMLPPNYQIILGLEDTNVGHEVHNGGWRPGWPGALHLGAQIAAAIGHMHSHRVIHRDIKPANVLLSSDLSTSRLADLGIAARLKESNDTSDDETETWQGAGKPSGGFYKRKMVGTLEYMAPEILLKHPHSPASDVFALAVTINEIAAGSVPYSDCTRDNPLAHTILEMGYGRQELAAAVAAEGLRPTIADGALPAVIRLLRSCWDADHERRPSASELAIKLAALASRYPWDPSTSGNKAGGLIQESALLLSSSSSRTPLQNDIIAEASLWPSMANIKESAPPAWAEELLHEVETAEPSVGPVIIGSFATAGARGEDKMEDRCSIIRSLFGLQHCSLVAVYDGHRGASAAEYLASSLERHLESRWSDSTSAGDLLRNALLDADEAFRQKEDLAWAIKSASIPGVQRTSFPGSTAVVALIIGRRIAIANLGDSRAVLCRGDEAVPLTQDQTAEREDERERILAAGGEVSVRMGGWRVGNAGLAVTRSIGDADVKNIGVIAEAEITELDMGSDDSFIIMGSDGIWDLVNPQEAVGIVLDTVKQPAMCAQRVVQEALARGSKDNVSAVVAFLPYGQGVAAGTAEKVFSKGQLKYKGAAEASAARVAARLVEDEIRETY